TRSFQRTAQVVRTTVGSAAPRTSVSDVTLQGGSSEDLTIPVGDFEAGVEWRTAYGWLQPFARAGGVDATWFDSGSATSRRGLGGGPLSGGRRSEIGAITPPNYYPQAVWDERVRQGRLKKAGRGTYELAEG